MPKFTQYVTIPISCLLLGLFAGRYFATDPNLEKIKIVRQLVQEYYDGKVAETDLYDGALKGLFLKLDPYSDYLNPQEAAVLTADIEGHFGGVGIIVEFDTEDRTIKVMRALEGSPASEAGLMPGDKISAIDGKATKDLSFDGAIRLIRGKLDTQVTLRILRNQEEPREVPLTRREIKIESIHSKVLEDGIAYIRVSDFSGEMMKSFDETLKKLQTQKLRGVILDLRFNTGGLLDAGVELSSIFLNDGVVVTTRGKIPDANEVRRVKPMPVRSDLPLVVLVNEYSASASEIVAGALQDTKRATLVGTRTFGKGSVQRQMHMDDHSLVKLTIAHYFTPLGRDIHKYPDRKDYGILPDRVVEVPREDLGRLLEAWNDDFKGVQGKPVFVDRQLDAAIEVLKEKLKESK